ncbi:MAG: SIMPL domain-containing protein [Clostridia bacterium]|nr:SIMPL domain-containing protein [Clostridia bacterium]
MKKVLGKVFGRALVAAMLATAMLLCAMAPGLASNNDAWAALLDRTVTAVTQMTTQTGELTVIGTASVAVQPDMATVMLGVSVEDVSVAFAQARVNQTMQSIVDALQALGIDQNRMITSNYSVFPTYDFSQDSVTLRGYQVNNMLSVQVQEFALISQVIDRAVLAGANQVQGITFDTSKRNEIYRGALQSAIAAAREKAAIMAFASGKQLGNLRSVTEGGQGMGGFHNAWDVRADSVAGQTSILGGELDVSAQVTLVFELK